MKNCCACAVHNCINYYGTNDGKWAFFPFPSDKNIKEYWIKKLQIKSVPEDGLVCSVNVHGGAVQHKNVYHIFYFCRHISHKMISLLSTKTPI